MIQLVYNWSMHQVELKSTRPIKYGFLLPRAPGIRILIRYSEKLRPPDPFTETINNRTREEPVIAFVQHNFQEFLFSAMVQKLFDLCMDDTVQ